MASPWKNNNIEFNELIMNEFIAITHYLYRFCLFLFGKCEKKFIHFHLNYVEIQVKLFKVYLMLFTLLLASAKHYLMF